MKPCLFTQSLKTLPLDEAIRGAAEAGYAAIELACAPPHLDLETAERHSGLVAARVHDAGLVVVALSLYNNFARAERIADEIRAAKTFIEAAPILEARIVKLTPGPPASADATEGDWARVAAAVGALAPVARSAGVRLAFETHMRQLTDTLASSLRFLSVTPADCVGLTVDFSNLRFAGDRVAEAIPLLADRMFHAHPVAQEGAVLVAFAAALATRCEAPLDVLRSAVAQCTLEPFAARFGTARRWLGAGREPRASEVRTQLGVRGDAAESCVTAVYLALRFINQPFADLVQFVCRCGGDADTIGAMAGGIWGASNGADALPTGPLVILEQRERLKRTAAALHARAAGLLQR